MISWANIVSISSEVNLFKIVEGTTTTGRNKLRSKWLSANPGEEGDVIKTAAVVAQKRRTWASLKATLVLTTARGPGSGLVSDVHELGRSHGLDIDLWDPSRLVHFLDHRENLLDDHRRQPERGFVEQEKPGSAHQGAGKGQHLLFAAR